MVPFHRLTDADIAIWRQVARTVVPRDGSVLPDLPPAPAPKPLPPPEPARPEPRRRSYDAAPYVPPVSQPKPSPTGLERRDKRRISAGIIAVDASLDLHGLTQAQAHSAVTRFLLGAQRDGARLVIIVTGKGLRPRVRVDAAEAGVLRRAVPFWLRDPAMRAVVMSFEEAALNHGGAGALYVRLRRSAT